MGVMWRERYGVCDVVRLWRGSLCTSLNKPARTKERKRQTHQARHAIHGRRARAPDLLGRVGRQDGCPGRHRDVIAADAGRVGDGFLDGRDRVGGRLRDLARLVGQGLRDLEGHGVGVLLT